jgi:hypothetical protein
MGGVKGFESCCGPLTLACLAFFCGTTRACAQTHELLCVQGSANFSTVFHTGVAAHVGTAKNERTADSRLARARLSWENQRLAVASEASEGDLDAFGVDLGFGVPVVAFQNTKARQ